MAGDDPEKLADFYTNLFGWQIQKLDMGGQDYWSISTGPSDKEGRPAEAGYIGGGLMKRQMPDQVTMNYVNVEDVGQYLEKAKSLGATEVMPKQPIPQMGWFAIIKDPQGNQFGIYQDDASAG